MLRPFGSWPVENLETLAQLESKGGAATNGETLLHCDLRDDNILVTRERDVYFIDWPEACIGAAWFDLVVMVSSLALVAGHEVGLDLLSLCAADHDAVAAALAGVAGFFVHGSCLPPPPGLPTVRQFQADQGHAALDLLRAWVD
jgi:aminoglycoside phosphotransferase (APT) family kinase protein